MKVNMRRSTNDMTKAAIAGLVFGTAFGIMANSFIREQNCQIKKTASKALNTVGETMQNISSQMK